MVYHHGQQLGIHLAENAPRLQTAGLVGAPMALPHLAQECDWKRNKKVALKHGFEGARELILAWNGWRVEINSMVNPAALAPRKSATAVGQPGLHAPSQQACSRRRVHARMRPSMGL
jgi:hypothetical protein